MKKIGKKQRSLRSCKKGSLQDLPFISAILLFLAVSLLIGFKITNSFSNEISGMSDIPARAVTATSTLEGFYPGVLDNSFLFFAIGVGLIVLVLAALVRIHPIFIPFFLMGLMFMIFLSGVHSNIYQEMAANSQLSALASQMAYTNLIMLYLPFIIGVFGFLLMIVQYKTWQVQQ